MLQHALKRASRITIALIITTAMFVLMNKLITRDANAFPDDDALNAVTFTKVDFEPDPPIKKPRTIPPKPKTPQPPDTPTIDLDPANPEPPLPTHIDMPTIRGTEIGVNIGPSSGPGGYSDGNLRPKSMFPPRFPPRATRSGEVTVQFTITKTGHVIDAVVIDSKPKRVFDRAALQAISKWTFWPKIVDGKAVATRATQVIEFSLDDE